MSVNETLQLLTLALDELKVPPGESIMHRFEALTVERYCRIAPAVLIMILEQLSCE
jgi:hypothetical protein